MKYLITIASLFVLGSVSGYLIELLFRRFISQKKWVNPGFMVGPYIPLYGFGVVILYGVSNIDLSFLNVSNAIQVLIIVITIGILMTLIELIAGLIFIKGMHLKLWDYSNRWGNFKGLICPLFSAIWFALGIAYYYLLNPILVSGISWINENLIYTFFVGIVVGMMFVDFAYSVNLGIKLKKASGEIELKFDEYKKYIFSKNKELKKKVAASRVIMAADLAILKESIIKFNEKLPKPKKWWKKDDNK